MIAGICIFLALIVWLVFGQTLNFDFVNFDDGQYVSDNAAVTKGVTKQGIESAFSAQATDNWVPFTTISHMVDCQFYGLRPGGHHFTNVLLHMAAVIFLFLALRRMTGAVWRSAFVAAVFAIHPLRAESVAWVSERKDVLCSFFFTLTLWAYAGYAHNQKSAVRYFVALIFGAFALMSKPVAVTLPFVLLALDYWPLGRFPSQAGRNGTATTLRIIAEKVPFLVLSVASCLPTLLTERQGITMTTVVPVPLRIENTIISYVIYIWQFIYPAQLSAFYRYHIEGFPFREVAFAFVLLATISWVVFRWRERCPYLLTGWLWYLMMLVPVIGLVQVGSQAHADRHTYLSEIGLGLLVTWLVSDWAAHWQHRVLKLGSLAGVVLLILIGCGYAQTSYWRNSQTLWSHAVDCDKDNARAYYNLGSYANEKGEWDDAITNFELAIKADPDLVTAHNDLGIVMVAKGDVDDAIPQYQEAIKLDPDFAVAHYNLGSALLQMRDTDGAIQEFRKALAIDPTHAEMRSNPNLALPEVVAQRMNVNYAMFHDALGMSLEWEGHMDEAIAQYQEALKLNPNDIKARNNLANALQKKEHGTAGVSPGQPDDAKTHNNLGTALRKEGRLDEAIAEYQEALKIDPDYAPAHYNLGNALLQEGKVNNAIVEYEAALKLKPDSAMVQKNVARAIWTLATSPDDAARNGTNAVQFAQAANQLASGGNALILRVLAAAYAEMGNFPAAIETGNKALTLATDQQNSSLRMALQQEVSLYQHGKATRADPANMDGWQ